MKLLHFIKYLFIGAFVMRNVNSLTLTDKQEIRINNMAWLLAQFSLTFDPNEISSGLEKRMNELKITATTSAGINEDQTMLSLYSYFRDNEQEFDNYKEVLDFFDNDHLTALFPSVNINELITVFEERVKVHQNDIVSRDETPLRFKKFYSIFQMLRDLIDTEFTDSSWPKFETLGDIPLNHPLMKLFCNEYFKSNDQDSVIKELNVFKIGGYTKNDKEIAKSLTLSHDFMNSLTGSSDPKPTHWGIHHMIPSNTIVKFYGYYFKLLSDKSEQMKENKKIDWIKISQYNTQKTFLVEGTKLWQKFGVNKNTKSSVPAPVYNFKNRNSLQENFVKYWYSWPIGLLFYGPRSNIRSDDPSHEENKISFNQPNDFELYAANIVGQEYFDKVKELNSNILAFIDAYELKTKTVDELFEIAFKIYNRLLTIHREAPWDNKIIAPYNSDQWELKLGKWKINTMWSVKALAQQQDLRQQEHQLGQFISGLERIQLLDPVLLSSFYMYRTGAGSHRHDETKRRKRHHLYDHLFYTQQLETKCLAPVTIIPKKDDCDYYLNNGSPSILAVPVYGLCKLFG